MDSSDILNNNVPAQDGPESSPYLDDGPVPMEDEDIHMEELPHDCRSHAKLGHEHYLNKFRADWILYGVIGR